MKFCWVTLHVRDLDASISFYQEIVGLKLIRKFQPSDDMTIAFLGDGETQLELICDKEETESVFWENISLGFVTESTDQAIKDLKIKGKAIHSGPFQPNPFIRFFYIKDPDGVMIQFVENIG